MPPRNVIEYTPVELAGVAYAIVREAQFLALCKRAGMSAARGGAPPESAGILGDVRTMAARIRQRRRAAGLTQAALAESAGIRTETLNRIERAKTEPDFRTIRKLITALKAAEARPQS